MSEENVEIVRSIYEAVNRKDWDAAFRDQRPDVELITPPGIRAGTYRGREEVQGYFEEWLTPFDEWSVLPEEFAESGDQVVAVLRLRAQPKGSKAEIDIRTGQLWTLRDGKTLSCRIFPKPADALEAAGLSARPGPATS
ncbi:MAG: nuclear transport factor 2 family protein [Solirubrobacterales bacterium]